MRHHAIGALFSLSLASLVPTHAWADAAAPITDVVLYPGGATVVRSVKVAPGATLVVIPRLPATFDARTLRIEHTAGVRVGETVFRDVANTEAFSPQEADAEARIQALRDQQAALDAEIKAADIVKGYLERVGAANSATGAQPAPDAKTITAQVDAIGRAASESLGKVQRLEVQKRELEKKVVALETDLDKLRTGERNSRAVSINVAAEKAGALKISYQIANAGWRPAYRGELLSDKGKVELERLAIISQKTGEDWTNARLVLSTSQPSNSPSGPAPQPWLLSYHPPQAKNELAMSYVSAVPAPAPAPVPLAPPGPASEDAGYTPPTFETQSTFATEFEVPARMNVSSDGREVSIQLASYVIPVRQLVRVAPRLNTLAYVVALGARPQGVWPVGPMQLFRDGNFVGTSLWQLADKEGFSISFGRDDLVRVSNNPVKEDAATVGLFNKNNERHSAAVFTVTSAHQGPIDIEVIESTPVATSDQIKIKATFDPKPTSEAWDQRRGVIAWERSLKPKENANFSVDYVIGFPKEGSVHGLR